MPPKKARAKAKTSSGAKESRELQACRRFRSLVVDGTSTIDNNLTIILSEVQLLLRAVEVNDADLNAIGHAALRCTEASAVLHKAAVGWLVAA